MNLCPARAIVQSKLHCFVVRIMYFLSVRDVFVMLAPYIAQTGDNSSSTDYWLKIVFSSGLAVHL